MVEELPVNDSVIHHQLHTAEHLYKLLKGRGLRVHALCDPVGFGKTYTTFFLGARLIGTKPNSKFLVVLPNERLKGQWEEEKANFTRFYGTRGPRGLKEKFKKAFRSYTSGNLFITTG